MNHRWTFLQDSLGSSTWRRDHQWWAPSWLWEQSISECPRCGGARCPGWTWWRWSTCAGDWSQCWSQWSGRQCWSRSRDPSQWTSRLQILEYRGSPSWHLCTTTPSVARWSWINKIRESNHLILLLTRMFHGWQCRHRLCGSRILSETCRADRMGRRDPCEGWWGVSAGARKRASLPGEAWSSATTWSPRPDSRTCLQDDALLQWLALLREGFIYYH